VEWLLDWNLATAQLMAALAGRHGAKSLVGIQGSFSPVIRKMKQILERRGIGKVLCSSIAAGIGNAWESGEE
jgi:predicted dehydrogenase